MEQGNMKGLYRVNSVEASSNPTNCDVSFSYLMIEHCLAWCISAASGTLNYQVPCIEPGRLSWQSGLRKLVAP